MDKEKVKELIMSSNDTVEAISNYYQHSVKKRMNQERRLWFMLIITLGLMFIGYAIQRETKSNEDKIEIKSPAVTGLIIKFNH